MNVTSTRFATKTRTWLLIAALTALLIGIGALVGGMFLYAFVALAAVMNVFGYWFSDVIALKASRAEQHAGRHPSKIRRRHITPQCGKSGVFGCTRGD